MKSIVKHEILDKKEISIESEDMPSGENRFRIKMNDNSAVNITNNEKKPSWQNAHYHKTSKEFYCVQSGYIIMAIRKNEKTDYKRMYKGDSIVIEPNIEHNVYMGKNSKTIVVKFGYIDKNDWYEAKELNLESRKYKQFG